MRIFKSPRNNPYRQGMSPAGSFQFLEAVFVLEWVCLHSSHVPHQKSDLSIALVEGV